MEGFEPDPSLDILYAEKEYVPKKTVKFQYEGRGIEYYYGVNSRNNDISNVLKFEWKDEMIELTP